MKKHLVGLTILGFIVLFAFGLLASTAKSNSETTDEGIHLFAGYSYLTQRDFRLDPEHPPLLKELAALPILFLHPSSEIGNVLWQKAGNFYYDSWQEARILSDRFFYSIGNNPTLMLTLARLPFILLTLALIIATYFYARSLYGLKAALFAALLIGFMPNILAHGILINTDLGLTLLMFLTVTLFLRALKNPKWQTFLPAGAVLGLALASKYTGLLIIPILLLLAAIKIIQVRGRIWLKYLGGFFLMLATSYIIILGVYGFTLKAPPKIDTTFSAAINQYGHYHVSQAVDNNFNFIRPLLVPADYVKGSFLVMTHAAGGHGAFLLGKNSNTGWWYYFPVAIFYKTPLAFFAFLILAIIVSFKIKAKHRFDETAILVVPLAYLLLAMTSKADLGVRHVLPIFPFLVVLASKSIARIDFSSIKLYGAARKKLLISLGFLLLILWYLLSSFVAYPDYLAYFNEVAGGPKGGYRILTDSNLDWGQDIYRIKNYLDEHPTQPVYIVYPWDSQSALDYYNIKATLLQPEDRNIKGLVVISATYYQTDAYAWVRAYPKEYITPGVFAVEIN